MPAHIPISREKTTQWIPPESAHVWPAHCQKVREHREAVPWWLPAGRTVSPHSLTSIALTQKVPGTFPLLEMLGLPKTDAFAVPHHRTHSPSAMRISSRPPLPPPEGRRAGRVRPAQAGARQASALPSAICNHGSSFPWAGKHIHTLSCRLLNLDCFPRPPGSGFRTSVGAPPALARVSRSSCGGDAPASAPPGPWLASPHSFPTWRPAPGRSLAAPSRLAGPRRIRSDAFSGEEDTAPQHQTGGHPDRSQPERLGSLPPSSARPAGLWAAFPGNPVNPGGRSPAPPARDPCKLAPSLRWRCQMRARGGDAEAGRPEAGPGDGRARAGVPRGH